MLRSKLYLFAGCCSVLALACGGGTSGESSEVSISDLRAAGMQWDHCFESFDTSEDIRSCLEEAPSGEGADKCSYLYDKCEAAAETGEDFYACEEEYVVCLGYGQGCAEPVIHCYHDLANGEDCVQEVVMHDCLPIDECEEAYGECMSDCGGDHSLMVECEAQLLVCQGVPEDCAYDYAECQFDGYHDGGEPRPAIEPAYPECDEGEDCGFGGSVGSAPPAIDCEEILDACECSKPHDPDLCELVDLEPGCICVDGLIACEPSDCAAITVGPGCSCEDGIVSCEQTGCMVGGCSGQLCVEEGESGAVSTCEWFPEYACYADHGNCERQEDGACGWTPTAELTECIETAQLP